MPGDCLSPQFMEGKGKVEIEKREREKEKKQWIENVRRSWWSSITLGCLAQTMDTASPSPDVQINWFSDE